MKKLIYVLAIAAAFIVTSCSNDNSSNTSSTEQAVARKAKPSGSTSTTSTAPVATASTCTVSGITVTCTSDAYLINLTPTGAYGYNVYVVDSTSTAPKAIINGVSYRAVTGTFTTLPIYIPYYISPLGKSSYTAILGCWYSDGTYCYSQQFPIQYQ